MKNIGTDGSVTPVHAVAGPIAPRARTVAAVAAAAGLLVGGLAASWLAGNGAANDRGDLIAQSLTIVDSTGKSRVHVGARGGQMEIALLSPDGTPVIRLATSEDVSGGPFTEGETSLHLLDANGSPALSLTLEPSRYGQGAAPAILIWQDGVVVEELGPEGLDPPYTSDGGEDEGETSFEEFGFLGMPPTLFSVVRSTSYSGYHSRRTIIPPARQVDAWLGRRENLSGSR